MPPAPLVLGLDFGSDSARALLVDARSGEELATAVSPYTRWAKGRYCDAARQCFRQHPQDYIDALVRCVRDTLAQVPTDAAQRVVGIGIDTTGSTPVAVDARGRPLALDQTFRHHPDAQFVLWKDHSAKAEAEEITALARSAGHEDYTRYCGGIYSAEWFWAKVLHITRTAPAVAKAAHSWVEHCDWLPALLCGIDSAAAIPRSRCAAGHKALWHASWGGLPPASFLAALDPRLAALRPRLYQDTVTADTQVGGLGRNWAQRLGLPPGIAVAAGAFDAHLGALGAGAGPQVLAKVMGTSTCDMITVSADALGGRCLKGICGQVDGSIMPGLIGLEAGQSAFGDVYAWFRRQLAWPLDHLRRSTRLAAGCQAHIQALEDAILPALSEAAAHEPIGAGGVTATDWFNGRRSPYADAHLRGALTGLHLGTEAPAVFRALVEATACGARAILDCFTDQGVEVKKILALGGIARRNPFIMQVCADVVQRPIAVVASDQCCALGAAMCGAVAGGAHRNLTTAQRAMASPVAERYRPQPTRAAAYAAVYQRYHALGAVLHETI